MRTWAHAFLLGAPLLQTAAAYWVENVAHQGRASFNPDPTYQVFRNVKDFGAKGDGVTDDTAAINLAISSGNRCDFGGTCVATTTTPATVYFPSGTYLVSSSVLDIYYTQLIGDPTSMPVIKASSNFSTTGGTGVIDADKYGANGLAYGSTNVFFRQIRNLVVDTTDIPANTKAYGIHWPSSQATSIQNVVFQLSEQPGNSHIGILMEEGSGGFLGDLVFYGGQYGAQFGNQQYTTRNLTFINSQTAILQLWDWYWVYKDITIMNCGVGINMTATAVGSVVLVDSLFYNTPIAIAMAPSTNASSSSKLTSQGSLVMENVIFSNVSSVFQTTKGDLVSAVGYNNTYVTGKVLGNVYTPDGPTYVFDEESDWFPSPSALKNGTKYYQRSKPLYEDTPASLFISPHIFGAKGDGVTDDTEALTVFFAFISKYYVNGVVGFVDAGYYKVTETIYIPGNIRIVGEALASVIMGAGSYFSDMSNPQPVVRVGNPGESGYIEWSDMIISTQGATMGAVLIEYNLAGCDSCDEPGGMWDVHIRVGGFAGSELQVADCPTTAHQSNVIYENCIAAYMGMHITPYASDLYLENNWFWVADHDIEDVNNTQISVYGGRGFLIESEAGRIWTVGSGTEHWTLYQYQLINTQNIWMGQIQSETPYYQPNPPAPYPFEVINAELHDPDFASDCAHQSYIPGANITAPCEMAWGLRIIDSSNVVVYGPGHYSFFNNYNTTCSSGPRGSTTKCQSRIVWIEDTTGTSENVVLYDLNTIGTISMVTNNGADVALWKDNWNNFGESLSLFKM